MCNDIRHSVNFAQTAVVVLDFFPKKEKNKDVAKIVNRAETF